MTTSLPERQSGQSRCWEAESGTEEVVGIAAGGDGVKEDAGGMRERA